MKLGSGNTMHRRARGGGIPKGAYVPEEDPTDSSWDDTLSYTKNHIPIIVNVIQRYTTVDGVRVLHSDSGAITLELVEEMISDVSEMMQGTYRNKHNEELVGGMTPISDNAYHGTGLNHGIKLAEFIPANYFNYWLYRHDNAVKTPAATATGTKTKISFDVQSISSGGNSDHQTIYNTAKNNLKLAGDAADDAYDTHGGQDLLDIKIYHQIIN